MKNVQKPILILIFSTLIFWVAYELFFEDIIYEYNAKQTEEELQENYFKKQVEFKKFLVFSKSLPNIDNIIFNSNTVDVHITDSLYNMDINFLDIYIVFLFLCNFFLPSFLNC